MTNNMKFGNMVGYPSWVLRCDVLFQWAMPTFMEFARRWAELLLQGNRPVTRQHVWWRPFNCISSCSYVFWAKNKMMAGMGLMCVPCAVRSTPP